MPQQFTKVDKPFTVLQEIDLVALHPGDVKGREQLLAATRDSITSVFRDFLAVMGLSRNFSHGIP